VSLIDDISKEPWRFDFYSVLRRIERSFAERPRIGDSASLREEYVALGQDPYMDFPASNLSRFERDETGRLRVLVKFLGLLGPQGALPLATTEEAYSWSLMRDDAFPRFLDILNHRFLQLFFRAWSDARPIGQHDRPDADRFVTYVGAMIGIGSGPFQGLDAVPDAAKMAYAGLMAPAEVLVNKQVLADPAGLGPEVKVWARLKDGTPLVTSAKRGDGQLIFFHVTANSDWSNLPLSGLFVEMLRRIASLGGTGGAGETLVGDGKGATSDAPAAAEVLAPLQVLDGFGLLKNPPPTTQAIAAAKIVDARPSAENPPGYYGPSGAPRALNLMTPKSLLKPLPAMPMGVERRVYEGDTAQPIKPQLLTIALTLLFRASPYFSFGVSGRRFAFGLGGSSGAEEAHGSALFFGLAGRAYFLESGLLDPYLELDLGGGRLDLDVSGSRSHASESVAFAPGARSAAGVDFALNSWLRLGTFLALTRFLPTSVAHCESLGCSTR